MKRITLILLILTMQNLAVYAAHNILDDIESSIFGYTYGNESNSIRVERIESYLYGSKKTGSLNTRIENIQNDIGFVKAEDKTASQMQRQPNESQNPQMPYALSGPKEDATVEYPMVDKIEQELFKTTYKNENIYTRLDRLEKQVFNKVSNESLNDRVDKLASVVVPKKNIKQKNEDYAYSAQDVDSYYRASGLSPVDNQSLPFQLAVLEQDLLKNNYDNDNISNRLNRLEQKLFKRTFSSDTDVTRLQRIMVAYDAKQNSYKYENNRKMQNMATMSQIGGILLMILAILL